MMTENQQRARHLILVFLRAPEKGQVKTRLAQTLGQDKVLALYKCFVKDTLQTLEKTVYEPTLCYYPSDKLSIIAQWLGNDFDYWPQEGTSLGDKMANCFIRAFNEGYDRVAILGTDVPDLPPYIINAAFEALETHQTVIGPSRDGGYYLIGFRADGFLPDIFQNMPWGTDQVLAKTLAVFKGNKASTFLLPPWQDIDEKEDLGALFKRHKGGKAVSCTMALLDTYSLF